MATEQVIIDIIERGVIDTVEKFQQLAQNADKASVTVDKLTGTLSGTITKTDALTGVTKNLTIEQNKVTKMTETLTMDLEKEAKAQEKVIDATKRQGTETGTLTGLVKGLASAFTALQVGRAAADILRLNDSAKVTSNTLRAYSQSVGEFSAASSQLQAIATQQGQSMSALTTAYGNLRTSSSFARAEVSSISGVLAAANAAIQQTAPSAQAAAAGLNSFTQVLADGKITGEEFSAIMREQPALAQALAEGAGMSAETIKVLGLSAEQATAALLAKKDALLANATASGSLSGAFDILKQSFTDYITQSEGVNVITELMVEGIKGLAKNLHIIIPVVATLTAGWVAYRVAVVAANVASVILNTTLAGGVLGTLIKLAAMIATATAAWWAYKAATDAASTAKTPEMPPQSQEGQKIREQQRKESYTRQAQAQRPAPAPSPYRQETGLNDMSGGNFGGFRAAGGPVSVGKQYVVGEEGPETFIPGRSGTIVPAGQATAMGGGMSGERSLAMLSDAVARGTQDGFDGIREELKSLTALVKGNTSSAAVASGLSAAVNDNELGGYTALNNFGQPAAPAMGGGGGYVPTSPSTPAPSVPSVPANEGSIQTLTNNQINALVKGYADLLMKNWDTRGMDLTDKQRQNNYLNAERYIANVPDSIRETVKQLANASLPSKTTGYSFRTGGAFTVGGSTGVDSKKVLMNVTPGEEVNIRTPKQIRDEREAERGNGGGGTFITMHVNTPDANSFRKSEKQIGRDLINTLMRATG